jgi:uncharacterized membrane protein YcaP (DUF421 family)
MDWTALFGISVSPLELMIRGTAVYWFLFLIFRFVIRRDVGAIGVADIIVLVIIADAAQNAMAGEYRTITEGFVLILTIVGWNVLLDWANFRFAWVRKWAAPPPLTLIRDGVVLQRNLRREFISTDELDAKLREHGIEAVKDVRTAYMESDGTVTVVKRSG